MGVCQGVLVENSSNVLKRQETEIEGSIFWKEKLGIQVKAIVCGSWSENGQTQSTVGEVCRRERDSATLRREEENAH